MNKNIKFLLLISLILIFQTSLIYAREKTEIKNVTVSDIDYPYSTGSTLDTTASLTRDSYSTVNKVEWISSYTVVITVRPNIYYEYSNNTTATVNGEEPDSVIINDKDYLEITYSFDYDSSVSIPNSSATLTHVISVGYSRHGTISPSYIRAAQGKNFTVTITPDEGYKIKDVIVDDYSVGAVEEYTFIRVNKPHKIRAIFEKIEDYEEEKPTTEVTTDLRDALILLVSLIFKTNVI